MFCFSDSVDGVGVAFTDRHGGVSAAPYDSLNLGTGTDDDPGSVARNYALVGSAVGVGDRVACMHQVHGADVAVVRDVLAPGALPRVDALVTDVAGLALSVRVADCVPVLIADPEAGVLGCAHAGRLGLQRGVVPRAVEAMRDLGASRLRAWIGPAVCGRCYEVPAEMQEQVAAAVPEARATTRWDTPALDLPAGVRAQLRAAGCEILPAADLCTRESPDLFSHRRDGQATGRSAGLVWRAA